MTQYQIEPIVFENLAEKYYKSYLYSCNELPPSTELVSLTKFSEFVEFNIKPIFQKHYSLIKQIDSVFTEIQKILLPLASINVDYSLFLTGGTIRDLLLNPDISVKDFDFYLKFNSLNKSFFTLDKKILSSIFSENQLIQQDWNDEDNLRTKQNKLLQLCLNQNNNPITNYYFNKNNFRHRDLDLDFDYPKPPDENEQEEQEEQAEHPQSSMLVSVTKTTIHNMPVDILLSELDHSEFLRKFDFNICKCSLLLKHESQIFAPNKLLDNLYLTPQFFYDFFNKTITYDLNLRTYQQIENSFIKHYPRIKKKLPKFKYSFFQKAMTPDIFEKAEILAHATELTLTLSQQQKTTAKVKI